MKQQLWVVNSSLIMLFLIALAISNLIRFEIPSIRIKTIIPQVSEKKKEPLSPQSWERIYKDDLFKTFTPIIKEAQQQSLVTPVPEPKQPAIAPPPEPKKQDFIAALTITVKGIIISDDEAKNVTMIEDETKKEGLYHLGDKIKDAQIIKIARNRIVFLRANGQQEIFFLRKDDPLLEPETDEKWNYIIKKTGDNSFEVDPFNFAHEVESLGNFIERTSIIGTASHNGSPAGLRIGELEKDELGARLGLEKNDIIVNINQFDTADLKNRLSIYDKITAMNLNDLITAKINRSGKDITLTYKLSTISKAKKRTFTAEPVPKQQPLKMSSNQEREKNAREFENRHGEARNQQEAIAAIRQRLMQNLRTRLQDTRTR